ncbi:hypothetical protein KC323_g230 [Hortaea werneckii]|nr:hypothetical protein KC323_g230 [Hortaea werneckii]
MPTFLRAEYTSYIPVNDSTLRVLSRIGIARYEDEGLPLALIKIRPPKLNQAARLPVATREMHALVLSARSLSMPDDSESPVLPVLVWYTDIPLQQQFTSTYLKR